MALKSASMGALLQGVNQQPDRVRLEGQVTEQINLISDVTTGLSTRPGSNFVSELTPIGDNPSYQSIVFEGQEYIISWDAAVAADEQVRISSIDGTDFTVIDTSKTDEVTDQYVGEDMVFTVVGKQIVVTNRDKVVKTDDTVEFPEWRLALFQALGGEFFQTYEVDLAFDDGVNPPIEVVGIYETPDGTATGDDAETTSDFIVQELVTALLADPNLPADTEISRQFDVASVYHPTYNIDITVSDGQGGTVLRGFSRRLKNPEDLPRYAPNGAVVEIANSAASSDNYWLKFETKIPPTAIEEDIAQNGDFASGDFTSWAYTSLSTNWSIVDNAAELDINSSKLDGSILSYPFRAHHEDMRMTFDLNWSTGSTLVLVIKSSDPTKDIISHTLNFVSGLQSYEFEVPAGYDVFTWANYDQISGSQLEVTLDNLQIFRLQSEDGRLGFGEEGVWRESYNPYEIRGYLKKCMPHVITYDDVNEVFVLSEGPWVDRPVGDSLTDPFSSLVDKRIRDTIGFEGRLALLTPETLVMSRTNAPFDLWRESATVVSDTDVIDIKSTKKNSLGMSWLVPFDRDLFIMADPGDSQFIVTGGGLTPSNASMVLTTEFEIKSGNARPQSTGRTILFPIAIGEFSGVKEFYTSSDVAVNAANTLTETQSRYINGLITQIEISQNFNIALFRAETLNTIWVYKYLWDSDEVLQSSWSKWEFTDEVRYMFFINNLLYMVSKTDAGIFYTHQLNLNRPAGDYGFHYTMDNKRILDATSTTQTVELGVGFQTSEEEDFYTSDGLLFLSLDDFTATGVNPGYNNATFIQDTGTDDPGAEAVPVGTLPDGTFLFDPRIVPAGSTVVSGYTLEWLLQPTQAFGRDYQSRIDTSKNITVQDYVVHVEDSGVFEAYGSSPYSDDWVYEPFEYIPDEVILSNRTYTGALYIPWGERADWSTFVLKGNDVRSVSIIELEWIGQVISTKGRRQ